MWEISESGISLWYNQYPFIFILRHLIVSSDYEHLSRFRLLISQVLPMTLTSQNTLIVINIGLTPHRQNLNAITCTYIILCAMYVFSWCAVCILHLCVLHVLCMSCYCVKCISCVLCMYYMCKQFVCICVYNLYCIVCAMCLPCVLFVQMQCVCVCKCIELVWITCSATVCI